MYHLCEDLRGKLFMTLCDSSMVKHRTFRWPLRAVCSIVSLSKLLSLWKYTTNSIM